MRALTWSVAVLLTAVAACVPPSGVVLAATGPIAVGVPGESGPAGPEIPRASAGPTVGAAGAVLWDRLDERALWGRAADVPRPMASTTKIMTTLLAVEAGTLSDTVVVSQVAAEIGRIPGAASLGLEEGQRVPMQVLLEGLMLRSGNDAAVAVAEHVAGTERDFVAAMNARARELGLDRTQFLNASGLTDDPRHHASPLDLARLADVALDEPAIARWASSPVASSEAFGTIRNRNELIGAYRGATGVKTGFTTLAGLCLVASAERDGRRFVSVVLGSEDHFADSRAILDHGFDDHRRLAARPDAAVARWRTSAGVAPMLPSAAVGRTVPKEAPARLVVVPSPTSAATVGRGDRIGELQLRVAGTAVAAVPLVAGAAIRHGGEPTVGTSVEDGLRGLARLAPRPVAG